MAKLSVIVAVFNEELRLRSFVEKLISSPCPIEREFIFIDDGSQDDTHSRLTQLSEEFPLQVIKQEGNQGKGTAIRRGIEETSGDFIMIQDADFEYNPNDVPALLKPLLDDEADIVYGSRFKQHSPQVHRTYHYFVNRFLTGLSNLFSGIYLTDMETCYKLFRADLIKSMNLTSRRFEIEVELTAYIAKTSARIYELPISYRPRTQLEGKKIGWRDGLYALYHIVRCNFRSFDQSFKKLPENTTLDLDNDPVDAARQREKVPFSSCHRYTPAAAVDGKITPRERGFPNPQTSVSLRRDRGATRVCTRPAHPVPSGRPRGHHSQP